MYFLTGCLPIRFNTAGVKKKSGDHKIASMSIHLTNDLLALGVTPAGSVVGGELKDFLPHVKNQLKDTKNSALPQIRIWKLYLS